MDRQKIGSGTKWENEVGYSRAVKVGSQIFVSGTTPTNKNGEITGINSPYDQTIQTLKNIEAALQRLGATLADVVRTRIYVINIDDWQEIGRAHGRFFKEIQPATTMVEVRRLIQPEILVEIEVLAILREP